MVKAQQLAIKPPNSVREARKGHGSREKSHFANFLEAKNLKLTRQREAVVDVIFSNPGHFEAEDLVQRLKNDYTRVSRATIYRTLELLQECQLVERLNFGSSQAFYEHVHRGEHHDHLICVECGNIIEFHNEALEKAQSSICDNFDFQKSHHSLRIFGLCSKCRQSRS